MEDCSSNSNPQLILHRYAIPTPQQIVIVTRKLMKTYWRSPSYSVIRPLVLVITTLSLGTIFFGTGKLGDQADVGDVQNVMGSVYSSTSILSLMCLMTAMPILAAERTVFYREQAASSYSPLSLSVATGVVEVPYLLAQVR